MKHNMQNIFQALNNKLYDLESSRYGKFKIYLGLLIFYIILQLPNMLVLRSFSSAVFPLNYIYISNNILFFEGKLNANLATSVISPSNILLDYPPGIYLLSYILGNLKNIFLFSFIVQSVIPILSYRLFRSVSSPLVSLLISIFSSFYFIATNWWSPDFLIQPLIMIGLIILLTDTGKSEINGWHKFIYLGLITGIVIILKHNEGIFWGVLVVSYLFFRSIMFSGDSQYTKKRPLLFALFAGYFAFGFLFLSKQIHADATVYYLLPYFTFLGLITYYILKNKYVGFESVIFLRNSFSFCVAALIIPLFTFVWVGSALGYARYFSSFDMGLQYQSVWDRGISGVLELYGKFQESLTLENIFSNYQAIIIIGLFILPFIINCLVDIKLFYMLRNKGAESLKKYLEITSLSIIGIFMFYPLEAYHILATKLFIFLFVLLYVFKNYPQRFSGSLKFLIIILVIPIILYSIYQPLNISRIETSHGSPQVEKAIGMPMEKRLAEELSQQAAVINRATQGNPYYVIDSSGESLTSLMAIENNLYPQFYTEMRKGIMNQEVTQAIISSLQQVTFVLVNSNDYQKYLAKQQDDPNMAQILKFINENYVIVDQYEAPKEKSSSISQIYSFLILKKSQKTDI